MTGHAEKLSAETRDHCHPYYGIMQAIFTVEGDAGMVSSMGGY